MTIAAAAVHEERLDRCPFCGGALEPRWLPARIWQCDSCELAYRNPMPHANELARLYEDGWREPEANRAETGGTDLRLARAYARRLAASLGREDFDGLRLIDFGAGFGTMSVALGELGAEVAAVEPFGFAELAAAGVERYRSLEEVPTGTFDGAVSLDVVEHLSAPWETLASLRRRLAPGAWLYVSTLNTGSLSARLGRAKWREARKAGHLVFFNPRGLELVLARAGFVDVHSPRWMIRYTNNPVRAALHVALQATGLETGLRAIAFNGSRP